ncbi:MAG: hypothetical protein HYT93_01175 [Parcubacteria group bacterium]|nr:hypothetical protein [Parcubacteria group bacterium]
MKGKINVCIFGDSIVYGQGDAQKGGWATRLRNYFELQANNELDVRIYALGIRGETTQDVLGRLPAECTARKPDIIIVSVGINDSQIIDTKETFLVPFSMFVKNIGNIFKTARRFTPKIIFVGLTPVDELKTTPTAWGAYYHNENIKQYDAAIKEFCHAKEITFISIFNLLSKNDLIDGIHPNSIGHKKMFENMRSNLGAVLN